MVKTWSHYNHIVRIGGVDNQIPDLYFFGLVPLSKSGFQCDVFFYLYMLPSKSNQRNFEGF